jgi:hypothetical protein
MMQKYPQSSEENTYIRMVISYWDMVASIVNRGLINDELFFESNGELWVVWDRMRAVVPTWRSAFKNPHLFANIEDACKRLEAWREKRSPGSTAARQEEKLRSEIEQQACANAAREPLINLKIVRVP